MDLMVLTDAELTALGCRLNGGTFGRDAARMTKIQKVAHCRELGTKIPGVDGADQSKRIVESAALSILQARKTPAGTRSDAHGATPHDAGDGDADGLPTIPLPDGSAMETPDAAPTQPFAMKVESDGAQGAQSDDEPGDDGEPAQEPSDAPQAFQDPKDAPPQGAADMLEARVRHLITEAMEGAADDAAQDIAEAVEARLGDAIATIRSELGTRTPRAVELKVPALPNAVPLTNRHPAYGRLIALLSLPADLRQGWGVGLVGPAGSGKSTAVAMAAKDLELPFGATSCSADMTTGVIYGRILPIGQGRYVPSELVSMIPNPGIYNLDELDAAAAEIIVAVNAPLANGGMHCEPRSFEGLETFIPKHPDFRFVACMNTWGTGATMQYQGRAAQDAALMDRWLLLWWNHDANLSRRIMHRDEADLRPWEPIARTDNELAGALDMAGAWIEQARERCVASDSRRILSVRADLKARACLAAGFSWDDTKDVLLAGWSADERAQVEA